MKINKKTFKRFLLKAFDIREGELFRALMMQLNIFLIICTLLIIKPTANGLFLIKFGIEYLPVAFILVAVTAAFVSTLYAKVLNILPLDKILTATLLFTVLCLMTLGILLRLNLFEGVTLYLFYILVAIFGVLATSQFWVLANLVFNPREAKRLFGFIGSGAIAGGIFGGYLTSIILQFTSSENLLFLGAGLIIICIPVNRAIWKQGGIQNLPPYQRKKRLKGFGENPLRLILNSRHLTYLACIVGISVMVAKLVDYQFSGIALAMIPDPDELTAFFGFWFSTFNVISLLFQLFLTRKLVGTLGVGSSLFFLPGMVFIASLILLFFPGLLLAAIFLKMSDGSLKQSLNKAAIELIILPVPMEIKNQTKTFIDVFVDSLAIGISGLVLIFLIQGLDLSFRAVSLVILSLIIVWIYVADLVRKEYLKSFKLSIEQVKEGVRPEKTLDFSQESVLGGLRKVLEKGTEKQIQYVLAKIRDLKDNRLFDNVRPLLAHPSNAVRADALYTLYFFKNQSIVDAVKPLTKDPDQGVKIRAFDYFLEHSNEDKVELMETYLNDPDYRVQGAALVSLAIEIKDNPDLKEVFKLEERINDQIEKCVSVSDEDEKRYRKIIALKVIGFARITGLFPFIRSMMDESDIEVVKEAILAASCTFDTMFIEKITSFLVQVPFIRTATSALIRYGKNIIELLSELANNPQTDIGVIRAIPSVAKQVSSQRSADFLLELLDSGDMVIRREAMRGLNSLKNKNPHLKFDKRIIVRNILGEARLYQDTLSNLYLQISLSLDSQDHTSGGKILDARKSLTKLLERRLDGNLERIFRLLGLKYPSDDIYTIYKGLRSKKPDLRLNALEFLDNLLEPSLKRVLIPLVETAILETISEEVIKNLKLQIPSEYECFRMLLKGKDLQIKYAVLYLIKQLNEEKYLPLVKESMENSSEKIYAFGVKVLHSIQSGLPG